MKKLLLIILLITGGKIVADCCSDMCHRNGYSCTDLGNGRCACHQ